MTSDIFRLVTGEQALLYLRVVVRGHHSAVSEGVRCGQHSCHDRKSAETTLRACTLDTERVPALREAASVMGLGVFARSKSCKFAQFGAVTEHRHCDAS